MEADPKQKRITLKVLSILIFILGLLIIILELLAGLNLIVVKPILFETKQTLVEIFLCLYWVVSEFTFTTQKEDSL